MTALAPVRRALISVSDKTDLLPFARSLREHGVEIVSTGGTARVLADAGIDVIPINEVTGFPEMMDGRVKSLHPAVHGAILGRRDVAEHVDAMTAHEIVPIDLVCINLYPFEQTIARAGVTNAEAIEQIDIGGPALIRSAAKNHQFVAVVTSATQYDRVVASLRANDGATTPELRTDLAAAAFMRTAAYDTTISAWMCGHRDESFPTLLRMTYGHARSLRYGENPHQRAALYADPSSTEASVVKADVLHGKPLSYNNIADAAAALRLVSDLSRTRPDLNAAVVVKHTNPCGAAVAGSLVDAFTLAHAGDPVAAYGGILALNHRVDVGLATTIAEGNRFLEVIVAPEFEPEAVATLGARWANVRLLAVGALGPVPAGALEYRSVPGGLLAQERDRKLAKPSDWGHVAGPPPDEAMLADASVAWMAAKHLSSNAIAIVANGQLIGAGSGQVDRVGACRLAVEKAGDRLAPGVRAVAASDAFFPFDDGPRALLDAGVTVLVHPGGSKRDEETFNLCDERGATCLVTGVRHFRH